MLKTVCRLNRLFVLLLIIAGVTLSVRGAQSPEISGVTFPQSFIVVGPVTNSEIFANASVCDGVGNTFVTGSFEGLATFGTNALNSSGGFAQDDVYLAKYDPAGNVLWARSAGGTSKEYGLAIGLDGAGGVFLTGTSDSYPFKIGTNLFYNVAKSMFVARYDSNGNLLWAQSGGSPSVFAPAVMTVNSLAHDPSGNVIVAGSFIGSPLITGLASSVSLTNKSAYDGDMFLAKYDLNGVLLWAKNYGGTNTETASAVATDSTGAIYVAGGYQTSTTFGAQTYTNLVERLLLAKFSAAGNLVWVSNLSDATNSNPGHSFSIAIDAADRITMDFQGNLSSIPFNYRGTNFNLSNGALNLLAQFDSGGNLLWLRKSPYYAGRATLAVDKQNSIYLGGNAGLLSSGTSSQLSLDVVKMSSSGDGIWTNVVQRGSFGPGLPTVSVDDSYVAHVSSTMSGGDKGNFITVGWTNIYPFQGFGQNQLLFQIAASFLPVPPEFLQQPTNMVFQPPKGLTNTALARAWPSPSYFWYKDGVKITSQTNFFLALGPTGFTNQASYFVVASNAYGMATSIVVNAQAGIAFAPAPPTNITVVVGGTVVISGGGTGVTPISSYRWRFNGTNLANATGATLTLTSITSAQSGNYTLVISNSTGAITSAPPTVVTVLEVGSIDPSWTAGLNCLSLQSLVRSPDGSYYVANGSTVGRDLANGILDTNVFLYHFWKNVSGQYSGPNVLLREPNGKILVGGTFTTYLPTPQTITNVYRLARLNTDGTLDSSFNVGNGPLDIPDGFNGLYTKVNSLIRLTNGQYLVAGLFNQFNGKARTNLVRLNNDGSLDNSFPSHSFKPNANYPSSAFGSVSQIVLQADGKLLVGGQFEAMDGVTNNALMRLNSDGTIDTSFSQANGAFGRVNGILPLADGRILAVGAFAYATNTGVIRYYTNGERDPTWLGKAPGEVYSITLLQNNKLLLTGNGFIRRFTYDGLNDTNFYTGTYFDDKFTYTAVLEPSGNVTVGGDYGLRRLLLETTPQLVPTFSSGSGGAVVNGQFQFSACGGMDGQTVIVQASVNLMTWVDVSTNVVTGGCISYTDPQVPALPNRYYRLSILP